MNVRKFLLLLAAIIIKFACAADTVSNEQRSEYFTASAVQTSSSNQDGLNSGNNAAQVDRCLESRDNGSNLIIYTSCRMASLLNSQLRTKGFVPRAVSFQSCLGQSLYSIYEVALFLEQFSVFSKWPSLTVYTDVQSSSPLLTQLWKRFSLKTMNVNVLFAQRNVGLFFQRLTKPVTIVLLCSMLNARLLLQKISEEHNVDMFENPNRWLIISEDDPSVLLQGISISFESNIIVATMNFFNDKKALESFPFKQKDVVIQYTDDLNEEELVLGLCQKFKISTGQSANANLSMQLSEIYDHLEDGRFNVKPIGFWFPENRHLDLPHLHRPLLRPLDGVHLVLAVTPTVPLTTVMNDSNGKLTMGAITEQIFSSLSAKMNFSYNILVPSDGSYGVKEDTGWTGMIGFIARKEANLTGTLIVMTPERIEVLDFAPIINAVTYGIMYLKPKDDPWDFIFFWSIFHPVVWLGVVAMIAIVTGIMLLTYQTMLLEGDETTAFGEKPEGMKRMSLFFKSAEMCFHTVVQKGAVMPSKSTTSTMIVFYTFEIFCVLIYTTYSSNITSILTTKRTVLPFDNLQELVDHPDYGIVLIKATNLVETLRTATYGPYQSAWKKIKMDTKSAFVNNFLEGIQKVRSSKVGFIVSEEIMSYLLRDTICEYQFTSQPVEQYGMHFAYRKDFPYRSIFNSYIATMQETGLLYRLFKESGYSRHRPSCNDETAIQSFELKKIVGLFVILAFGILLASIVTGMERIIYKHLVSGEKINKYLLHGKTIHTKTNQAKKIQATV